MFHHYSENIEDGIQIRVYRITMKIKSIFASLFHLTVKKNLRKSQV